MVSSGEIWFQMAGSLINRNCCLQSFPKGIEERVQVSPPPYIWVGARARVCFSVRALVHRCRGCTSVGIGGGGWSFMHVAALVFARSSTSRVNFCLWLTWLVLITPCTALAFLFLLFFLFQLSLESACAGVKWGQKCFSLFFFFFTCDCISSHPPCTSSDSTGLSVHTELKPTFPHNPVINF